MDDFTDFESVPSAAAAPASGFGGDDAVTDFLAREAALQQQLGENISFDESQSAAPAAAVDAFGVSEAAASTVTAAVVVGSPQQAPQVYSSQSNLLSAPANTSNKYSGESEHVRKWKVEQTEKIATLDRLSASKHEETVQRARKEIDQFYEDYNQKKTKLIARNRETEKNFLKGRDEEGKTVPNVWERIVNQVDLNAVPSKTKVEASKSTGSAGAASSGVQGSKSASESVPKKDTSRFKSMLLQLKNDTKAPGNEISAR